MENAGQNIERPSPEAARAHAFARIQIDRIRALTAENAEPDSLVNKIMMQQLRDLPEDQSITVALPTQDTPNSLYKEHSSLGKKQFLRERLQGKVLDVGSNGIDELQGVVADDNVVYLDQDPFHQKNFVQAKAQHLPFPDGTFDGLYSSGTLHGEEKEEKAMIAEMLRVVKPKGAMVLSPTTGGIVSTLTALSELGIDIENQCELTLDEAYIQHSKLPIKINQPQLYITARLDKTDQQVPMNQDREYRLEESHNLVASYQTFQRELNPQVGLVYYPTSGTDISASKGFPSSRVVYVDIDPKAVAALKKAGYEAYEQSALEYKPNTLVDVLILPSLPRKKGHMDDTFVFKKRQKQHATGVVG